STFLGGSGSDSGSGIQTDFFGNAYLTGSTSSTDFPTASPLQPTIAGSGDAFVAKLNTNGTALVFSTYFGGTRRDAASAIALDVLGNVYIGGRTDSTDFPTQNALQPTLSGSSDAFVTKFNRTASALVYSTYLGGSSFESCTGLAVDALGHAYVTGVTTSSDFPVADAVQPTPGGPTGGDIFTGDTYVTKLNTRGSGLIYSTYLGGSNGEFSQGIALDILGNAYVTGITASSDFPTTP